MAPQRPRPPRQPRVRVPRDHRDTIKRRGVDLLRKIEDKDRYAIFLQPVDLEEVPTYTDVISRPMDLGTIRNNLLIGVYRTPDDLRADLDLIWSNCCKFNADGSIYYREAVRLRALAGKYFEEFLRNLARDGLPYGPRRPGAAQPGQPPGSLVVKPGTTPLQASLLRQRSGSRARSTSTESVRATPRRPRVNEQPNAPPPEVERPAPQNVNKSDEKEQIYSGPYYRLKNMPHLPTAAAFPYVRGTALEWRAQPMPLAWKRLGRWQKIFQRQPDFMSAERDVEIHYARCYQDYVKRSAPLARRLLATVLDPEAVVEHDRNVVDKTLPQPEHSRCDVGVVNMEGQDRPPQKNANPDLCSSKRALGTETEEDTEMKISPSKRPRHAELPSPPPDVISKEQLRKLLGPDFEKEVASLPAKPASVPPPSPDAVQDLRKVLKAHRIDDSFLEEMISGAVENCNDLRIPENPGCKEVGCNAELRKPELAHQDLASQANSAPILENNSGKIESMNLEKSEINQKRTDTDSTTQPVSVPPQNVEKHSNELTLSEKDTSGAGPKESDTKMHTDEDTEEFEESESEGEEEDNIHENTGAEDDDEYSNEDDSESGSDRSSEESFSSDSDSECEMDPSTGVTPSFDDDDNYKCSLDDILSTNHSTLLNLLRIRALKECCSESERQELIIEEKFYFDALAKGVALVTSKLPPKLLIPREKAAALALSAAQAHLDQRLKEVSPKKISNSPKLKDLPLQPKAGPPNVPHTSGGSKSENAVPRQNGISKPRVVSLNAPAPKTSEESHSLAKPLLNGQVSGSQQFEPNSKCSSAASKTESTGVCSPAQENTPKSPSPSNQTQEQSAPITTVHVSDSGKDAPCTQPPEKLAAASSSGKKNVISESIVPIKSPEAQIVLTTTKEKDVTMREAPSDQLLEGCAELEITGQNISEKKALSSEQSPDESAKLSMTLQKSRLQEDVLSPEKTPESSAALIPAEQKDIVKVNAPCGKSSDACVDAA